MSNKAEILSFDEWINGNGFNFRPEQYDLYKFLYESGQQSKQAEIEELQKNFNNALKTIDIQQQFLDDTDGVIKIITSQVGELQNRIESAMELLEYNEYVDSALQALEILKGYKLVLVEPTDVKLKEFQKIRFDSGCAHIMKKKKPIGLYKAMMGEESK